jgi:hypothetical protein
MKRNKYSAIKTVVDGIKFDSKREAKRYAELKLLERAGEIADLELQPCWFFTMQGGRDVLIRSKGYPNGRRATYSADFRYRDSDGQTIIEDVKTTATDTEASRLRRAMVEAQYGVRVVLA